MNIIYSSRCGLSNEDLNRRWKNPHPILHPEIYHTKGLLEYCCRVLKKPPFVFCDFHGHSRKKNVFLYGCANSESWSEVDKQQVVSPVEYLLIAHLMKHFCPAFSFSSCKFRVERSREATARVAVWRDFKIKRSYTMESSYCGCDQGVYSGRHLDTIHLKEVGKQFCEALACLHDETTWRMDLLLESQEAAANFSKFGDGNGNLFPKATRSGSHSDLLSNTDSSSGEEDNDVEED
ncbi:hypothetical protein RUM43_005179 [Polyplax serrata]|uniref:Peptidase M14 domain-containing protein n=1 Tax=Polyplax serrata TaxID=468196 RepID=A0AAN8SD32_POLSC